jgi:hypothetical protein
MDAATTGQDGAAKRPFRVVDRVVEEISDPSGHHQNAIAAASARYGMAACLSATSAVYLLCGSLLVAGTAVSFPRPLALNLPPKGTRSRAEGDIL